MSEKPWQAKKEEIETDFEETRRCLLNSYHSYVQTHAGYMIAIIIGSLALISNFEPFFKNGSGSAIWFVILIILIIFASSFVILRIVYWTCYASFALYIPIDKAIGLFNEKNSPLKMKQAYFEKAPCTAILQIAIMQDIETHEKTFPWWKKLAMKTG